MSEIVLPICRVAAGILFNANQQVLIAERPANTSYAGFWEFPGGKLEGQETVEEALKRELLEEIGVKLVNAEHLITINYMQPALQIELHVYKVLAYVGTPHGREGQQVRWVDISQLSIYEFPPANAEIIACLAGNLR